MGLVGIEPTSFWSSCKRVTIQTSFHLCSFTMSLLNILLQEKAVDAGRCYLNIFITIVHLQLLLWLYTMCLKRALFYPVFNYCRIWCHLIPYLVDNNWSSPWDKAYSVLSCQLIIPVRYNDNEEIRWHTCGGLLCVMFVDTVLLQHLLSTSLRLNVMLSKVLTLRGASLWYLLLSFEKQKAEVIQWSNVVNQSGGWVSDLANQSLTWSGSHVRQLLTWSDSLWPGQAISDLIRQSVTWSGSQWPGQAVIDMVRQAVVSLSYHILLKLSNITPY